MYTIERTFARRSDDTAIGKVTLTLDNKGVMALDGETLPESSVKHLLTFALQTLQDAYAGADSYESAVGLWNCKLDKIKAGTIGTRGAGSGMTEFDRVAISVCRLIYLANCGDEKRQAYKASSSAGRDAIIAAFYAANEAALYDAVAAEVAERKAKAEKTAKLAKSATFNI